MTSYRDMYDQVQTATDASDGTYDVDAIVEALQKQYGTVNIDTIDAEDFWAVVAAHAETTEAVPTAETAELTDAQQREKHECLRQAATIAIDWATARIIPGENAPKPDHEVTDALHIAQDLARKADKYSAAQIYGGSNPNLREIIKDGLEYLCRAYAINEALCLAAS